MKKLKSKRVLIISVTATLILTWWLFFPSVLFKDPPSYVIFDRNNELLGATIASDGQWRFPERKSVPERFEKCILQYEDRRFYYHPGIDPIAIGRAIVNNLKKKNVQGASTLSMQVMRISHEDKKRTFWQKLIESFQAVRLECTYSKKRILSLYASHAPFGGNVVGLEAAAWRYFGRQSDDLTWGEAAALAVLPNSPALIHPGRNREILLEKRNRLLRALLDKRIIDKDTYELSLSEPLPGKPVPLPQYAPHLLQRFRKERAKHKTASARTSIDLGLQMKVSDIVQRHHEVLKANAIKNLSALVLDVETGEALAYVGNISSDEADYQSYVDIVTAPRSPGSTLKPILFAAAMTDGQLLPDMLLPDVPTQIGGYTPQNFDRSFDGAVPASEALSRSLNIPAVKVLQQYKYDRFYALLKQLGISTLSKPASHYGLSIILGGSEVTLWDLAGAYAGMARSLNGAAKNEGRVVKEAFFPPSYIINQPNQKEDTASLPALDATSLWFAFQSMEELSRPGEEGLWQQFTSSKRISWKTGTSFGFRDAWAIGVTTKYAVAVWAGNADGEGRPELLGIKSAAPVMFDIFRQLPVLHEFPKPQANFAFLPVCPQSGFKAGPDCASADTLMMPPKGQRTPMCPYHQTIHLDATGTHRVTGSCYPVAEMVKANWFVLPPTMEWYYRQLHPDYQSLPPFLPGCHDDALAKMELVYPTPNAKVYIPLEIDGQRGRMICIASHRSTREKIFWHLDGEFIGTTQQFHRMPLSPTPGKHTLTIVDESGETLTRYFEILEPKK